MADPAPTATVAPAAAETASPHAVPVAAPVAAPVNQPIEADPEVYWPLFLLTITITE